MRKQTKLTNRQIEILSKLEKGKYYKEIGQELGITPGTVKQHIHQIFQKYGASNRTEAVLNWRNFEQES